MPPPLRPLPSLLDGTISSRLQPRNAFHIQRHLFHGTKAEKGYPQYRTAYRDVDWSLTRKEQLIKLSFPRRPDPDWSAIKWMTRDIPRFLGQIFVFGVRYAVWPSQRSPPRGVVVKSRIGYLFFDFVTQRGCLQLFNTTFGRWGLLITTSGASMLPTLGANSAIAFYSYAYTDRRDVSRGDVVCVLAPKQCGERTNLGKRIAALEGDRIWVTGCNQNRVLQRVVQVPPGHCFLVGDNPSRSADSRHLGALPIETIWAKGRWAWGLDGFYWIKHGRHPWLKNKAIIHLAPGQSHPSQGETITQPKRSPTVVPKSNEKPQTSPPTPPKKQQMAKEQQTAKKQQMAKKHRMTKKQQKHQRKKR